MTALPLATASCDAAYATESLEHAVDIPKPRWRSWRASCKPGGRIVIIDKNAEAWGRLETPEWERWFGRKELERLLAPPLPPRLQPAHLLLGRRRARRAFSGLVCREIVCGKIARPEITTHPVSWRYAGGNSSLIKK